MASPIDFDGDALKLFRAFYQAADDHQKARDEVCERSYQHFHAYMDLATRNPDRSNVTIPKIYSIVMTKLPREIRAVFGRRPYIPFVAKRDEYREYAKLQSNMLDSLLYKANFKQAGILATLLKMSYGTSFVEALPYYKVEYRRVVVPDTVPTWNGPETVGYHVEYKPARILNFSLTVYAPWEIKVDPFAKGLESKEDCRGIIKVRIASKRQIRRLAEMGAYPGLDLDKLDANPDDFGEHVDQHFGLSILENMGLDAPDQDSDIGVLFRYESPDRYIDVWNDWLVLRDRDNPFREDRGGHGMWNLSRMVHNVDPHTQAQMWGNGEIKINEVSQTLLNDLYNMAIDNHQFNNHGMTYYKNGCGVAPEELVRAAGNKVGLDLRPDEKIGDVIQDTYGQPLPRDHYEMLQRVEDYMDLTSGSWEVQRGEDAKGTATLGEVSLLREASDFRQEMNVGITESIFMTDFGHKCLCHIDQWSRHEDKVEYLGEQDAMRTLLLHPRDLPGGFDYQFQGAETVVNQAVRQRNLVALNEAVASNQQVIWPQEWLKVLFDAYDLSEEAEKIVKSDEQINLEQQIAVAQAELDQAGAAGQTPGPKEPNNANMAQEAGRASSPL